MILTVSFDDKLYDLDIPAKLVEDAEDFYSKMDNDMDSGWQISREWVENPDLKQRCQVVADKILAAFHCEDEKMVLLMAGYILSRMPYVKRIAIDTSGDVTLTAFGF